MSESIIQRAFAAGELAPVLHARADTAKYATGLKTCRNFVVRREGGVSNRAGFRFVEACLTDDEGTRLMRYVGSIAGEAVLIEMGDNVFRFFQDGALLEVSGVDAYDGGLEYEPGDLVEDGGVNYYAIDDVPIASAPPDPTYWHALEGDVLSVPTPYSLNELPNWNQSGNVITLTHPNHPPRELTFIDTTHWTLRVITTEPELGPVQTVAGTPGAAGTLPYRYIVTGSSIDTYEEGLPSAPGAVTCATPTAAAPNAITWDALTGAVEYNVYLDPYGNGVFGFIGTAATEAFSDPGIDPDFFLTPPIDVNLFASSGNYPTLAAQYQQRRFFANTDLAPDAIFGSRIGFRTNFGISSPLQDDDAVTFRLAGNNHHPIRHMAALKAGLILLTDGGEWTITGGGGPLTPITPSSIEGLQETYVGASPDCRPVIVGNAVLYVQSRGSIVRDLRFDQQVEGLGGRDLTIYATHLFERKTLIAMDYQQVPHSIIWTVRSDGTLLGLTYIPDQDIWGWHRHDTGAGGQFEDVCVLPEAEEDVVYVIVKRTIDGNTVRYIERLERRELLDGFIHASSFFVDSGLSYAGAPATVFSGLEHLEGEIVAVLADGVVRSRGTAADAAAFTVTAGTITLEVAAANVHIGLPIVAELETLDLDVQGSAIRDKQKRTQAVTLLVEKSAREFLAGPDASHLRTWRAQDWEGSSITHTGQLELTLTSAYNKDGRVVIQQLDPLALTILAVIPNVEPGG